MSDLRDVESVVRTLRMIRDDIASDMAELDGKPFDGKTVAEAFGKLAAQVDVVAAVLILQLEGKIR